MKYRSVEYSPATLGVSILTTSDTTRRWYFYIKFAIQKGLWRHRTRTESKELGISIHYPDGLNLEKGLVVSIGKNIGNFTNGLNLAEPDNERWESYYHVDTDNETLLIATKDKMRLGNKEMGDGYMNLSNITRIDIIYFPTENLSYINNRINYVAKIV